MYANTTVFKLPRDQEFLGAFDKDAIQVMTPVKIEKENSGRC